MRSNKNSKGISQQAVTVEKKATPSIGYALIDESVVGLVQLENAYLVGMIKQFKILCSLPWNDVAIASGIGWDRVHEDGMKKKFRVPTNVGRKELYHIKIGRKPRVWGYREGDVFQVVWFDPNHEVTSG